MENISLILNDKLETCEICRPLVNKKVRKTDRSFWLRKHIARYIMPGLTTTISKNADGEYVHGHDCFIPQGICVTEDYIFISAYDYKNLLNSVVYVCNRENGAYLTTLVLPNRSHCGGLSYDFKNNYIWVCDNKKMGGIQYDNLKQYISKAIAAKAICLDVKNFDYTFATACVASFSNYYDGLVWVGQFDVFESMKVYGYEIDVDKNTISIKTVLPVPKKTQGIAFYKRRDEVVMVTSNSYRRTKYSRLYFFKLGRDIESLDDKIRRLKSVRMLPMSEGIDIVSDKLFIVFESGAIKYSSSKKSKKPTDMYYVFDLKKLV